MKKTLLLLFVVFSLSAFGQTYQYMGAPGTTVVNKGSFRVDSFLYLPNALPVSSILRSGALRYNTVDSSLAVWTGTQWLSTNLSTSVASAYVKNQYASKQTANAWFDSVRLSSLRVDSLASFPSDTFTVKNKQKPHFAVKNDVAYFWSVTNQRWETIGPASTTATTQQMVSEFAVIDDKGRYDMLPNPVVNEDTILMFSKNAASHTANGNAVMYKSTDGGTTWDSSGLVTTEQILNLSAGTFARDHIVYNYQKNTDGIYHTYSLNGGRTWTLSDSTKWSNTYPHGHIIQLPGGRLLQSVYRTSGNIVDVLFSDDGMTWDSLGRITTLAASGYPYNEASMEIVSGTTNQNAVLVALLRQESAGSIHSGQFYSTDGGVTWAYAGSLTFGHEAARAPTFLKAYRGYLYAIKGVRREYETSGQYSFISYKRAPLSTVYNDTTKWSTGIPKIYQSTSQYLVKTLSFSDFGYAHPFVYGGKLLLAAYDMSPDKVVTGWPDTNPKTIRMFVMPVLRSPYYDGWGYGNQPIPTGTATKVAFQTIFYDTEGLASATDSGYLVQRDGDYTISATITIAGDTTGTYREVYIALDDKGVVDTSGMLDIVVQQRRFSGTDNVDFNKVTLSGTVFAKAGNYLRVYVRHDATTSLDVINSLAAYRARLIVKQIQ